MPTAGRLHKGRYPDGVFSKESKSMAQLDMSIFQLCVAWAW
jgi:hypothetical protein